MPADLLEREDELARLEAALARARGGTGGLVVIEGEAGIGKSALVGLVRASAVASGMRVQRARGAELEREFAFGVARQLVEPALHATEDREALIQGPAALAARLLALPGAPPGGGAPETADPLFAILHGLYWLVANLAARAPLCLAVDDAHWADAPSLRFLNFLRARIDELPVTLVVATRPAEPGAAVDQLAALTADPAAEVIRPAPLSGAAVAALLEEGLGATPAPAFAAASGAATGGLPFLARELAARLREEGIAPTADAAPRVGALGMQRVGRWIGTRLDRLPEGAARLARATAVLERADLSAAGVLAGLGEDEAGAAAQVLTDAGLLRERRPLEFAHPLVRRAVYDAVPATERAVAHRRAAELLAGVPGADGRVAEHLLATEPAGDAWVAERLGAAAERANAAGAPESAAVYLTRVLAEPPPPERRVELLVALGTAEDNAGRPSAAAHLREAVEAAAPGGERVGAVLALANALFRQQRFAESIELLEREGAALGPDGGAAADALDVAASGIAIHDAAIAPAHGRRIRATRARADAEEAPSPHLLGVAAFIAVLHNEPAEACATLAARAHATLAGAMPAPADVLWFNQGAITLLWTERWEELDVRMDAAVAAARASGDASLLAGSLAYRGWMRLRRGDLAAAESDARMALETADLPAPALYRLINAGVLVETLIELADLDGAAAVLDGFGDLPAGGHAPNAYLRLGRARLRLAQARPADALADALAVGDVAGRIGIACPSALSWRSEAALAQAQLGQADAARALADEEVALARAFGAPRTLGAALTAAGVAAGEAGGAPLLREAIDRLDAAGARLALARAQVELGALLRRGNQRGQARELLEAASATARECGGTLLAERAAVELAAAGARARRHVATGRQALTASERRVAELAADGHTNRDIAQLLFITTRTVEGHLREAYGKLGLRGREGLAAALAG